MVSPPDAVPGRLETSLAYAGAALSSLVWVGCVMPGIRVPPGMSDDAATPMGLGALFIVPALLLLVAGPVAAVLARGIVASRALLAAGDAFVTWFVAGIVFFASHRGPGILLVVAALLGMGAVAVRDAVVVLREGSDAQPDSDSGVSRRYTDLRLALSILALLTPAQLLVEPGRERASLLAPFAYVAISALGERFAASERGLRLTGAILFALVAAHLVIALHYVLTTSARALVGGDRGVPWTWAGTATLALALGVLATAIVRAVAIARGPRDRPA